MYFKYIVIRREYKKMEYRTPLIPQDCKELSKNIIVYVEKDNNRCYSDEEYSANGCIMIDTYLDLDHKEVLVIGLKELELLNDNFKYNHMYFSHTLSVPTQAPTGIIPPPNALPIAIRSGHTLL